MRKYLLLLLPVLIFISCEKEIEIKPKEGRELLVVEGHIEPGLPPYVILSKSQSFFSSTNLATLSSLLIRNADIFVSDGTSRVKLQEIRSDSLPDFILDTISAQLGVKLATSRDPSGLILVFYTTFEMLGEEGKTYDLEINAAGQQLKAVTSIPYARPLDSLWTVPHPTNDTLVTLYVRYTDPPGERNFVRYFTSVDGGMFYPPYFNSVLDDRSLFNVDGKTFDIPLEKGHSRYEKGLSFNTFTYFSKGDTIALRWTNIDQAHFDFWSTAEFDRNSGGNPFSTPIRIKSNIQGGLGIWGGYSPSYHLYIVQP